MRLRSAMSASTRSAARTFVEGFAGDPFTTTWPPSHNRVASGRVFTRRTAHSQRSMRVSPAAGESVTPSRMARLEGAVRRPSGADRAAANGTARDQADLSVREACATSRNGSAATLHAAVTRSRALPRRRSPAWTPGSGGTTRPIAGRSRRDAPTGSRLHSGGTAGRSVDTPRAAFRTPRGRDPWWLGSRVFLRCGAAAHEPWRRCAPAFRRRGRPRRRMDRRAR